MAKELVAHCRVAPYGKGTQTLVNKKVRNTFELDPKKFRLSDEWNAAIADATRPAAEQLGLPAEQLEARLYKLLVYEKGGFFLPHRDSEKHDRMVASLIVVLPNPFEGGALIVRHGAAKQTLTFRRSGGRQGTVLRRVLRRLRTRSPTRHPRRPALPGIQPGAETAACETVRRRETRRSRRRAGGVDRSRGSRHSRPSRWSSRWSITTRSADCRWIC